MADADHVKRMMLEEIASLPSASQKKLRENQILDAVLTKGGFIHNFDDMQTVLTVWHDLHRSGVLAPGFNCENPGLPFAHITEHGRRTLENLNRDPANSEGYLKNVHSITTVDSVIDSYVTEGIRAYNNGCGKSAAVMIGCATERLVLLVRNELVSGLERRGLTPEKALKDWKFKTVRDAIQKELDREQHNLPKSLRETVSTFWSPLTEQMRMYRNDAGHPTSIDPVTQEMVHANLLLFPELLRIAAQIMAWMKSNYAAEDAHSS